MNSQEAVSWVQAGIALIVGICTIGIAKKSIHAGQNTILKLSSVDADDINRYTFKVHNLGTAAASDVKLKVTIWSLEPINTDDPLDKMQVLVNIDRIYADGPSEVGIGESTEYQINSKLYYKMPLELTWKTTTGKNQKTSWLIDSNNENKIRKLNTSERIKYKINWWFNSIKTPFIKIKARKIKKLRNG